MKYGTQCVSQVSLASGWASCFASPRFAWGPFHVIWNSKNIVTNSCTHSLNDSPGSSRFKFYSFSIFVFGFNFAITIHLRFVTCFPIRNHQSFLHRLTSFSVSSFCGTWSMQSLCWVINALESYDPGAIPIWLWNKTGFLIKSWYETKICDTVAHWYPQGRERATQSLLNLTDLNNFQASTAVGNIPSRCRR